jgi:hypothetical protein
MLLAVDVGCRYSASVMNGYPDIETEPAPFPAPEPDPDPVPDGGPTPDPEPGPEPEPVPEPIFDDDTDP